MACDFRIPVTDKGDYYFISYNSEDTDRVAPIVQNLNSEGIPMWYDSGIDYGDLWEKVIAEHVANAKAVIIFFTKGILEKENSYVSIEYEMATKYFNKPIYIVFLDEIDSKKVPMKSVRWMIELNRLQNVHLAKFSNSKVFMNEILKMVGCYTLANSILIESDFNENKLTPVKISISEGDTIKFGQYRQNTEKPEPIEWKVLKREGVHVLLISKYCLNAKKYNSEFDKITWEECTLRKWLNSIFMNEAFSNIEQKQIRTVTIENPNNPEYLTTGGKQTQDQIFLLNIQEVKKYLPLDNDRMCVPTAYAISQRAYIDSGHSVGGEATCWWWLRSLGYNSSYAACISNDGAIDYRGALVNNFSGGIRPALWIDLES